MTGERRANQGLEAAELPVAEVGEPVAALERIAAKQQEVLAVIEKHGFVFEDIGCEPGNWQHLAFTLYTDICEIDTIARHALGVGIGDEITAATEPALKRATPEVGSSGAASELAERLLAHANRDRKSDTSKSAKLLRLAAARLVSVEQERDRLKATSGDGPRPSAAEVGEWVPATWRVYCGAYVGPPLPPEGEAAECSYEFFFTDDDPEQPSRSVMCPSCGAECEVVREPQFLISALSPHPNETPPEVQDRAPFTVRGRIADRLDGDEAEDFAAILAWEDEMLDFCNRLAEENDRLAVLVQRAERAEAALSESQEKCGIARESAALNAEDARAAEARVAELEREQVETVGIAFWLAALNTKPIKERIAWVKEMKERYEATMANRRRVLAGVPQPNTVQGKARIVGLDVRPPMVVAGVPQDKQDESTNGDDSESRPSRR